ncbi:MAG: AAA family ATPase, partial [Gammaproteobacteria bacterium]|nr:AAA family ATPase [Gammaproteobacteria bacterium]
DDENHIEELNRFLRNLSFSAFDDKFACTPSDLIRLGRCSNPSLTDEDSALGHGATQFKVSRENLLETYSSFQWAKSNILIAVSGTADGSSGVRESADKTLREEIEKAAHLIFASSIKQRDFWLGKGVADTDYLNERYNGPKPCVWGSDAHSLDRVGRPDSDRFTWIRGNPATFDSLRQACIDPERAYIGSTPPTRHAPSQVIDSVHIENAPWLRTQSIQLNQGLVAIIGARGSGKTALVDVIAAGCDAYVESSVYTSFLSRAKEHISDATVSLSWQSGDDKRERRLDNPADTHSDAYPRARYLSQRFVEELCSNEGMPTLVGEIERVIFEAHPQVERDGAIDFEELLEFRASRFRDARKKEEETLVSLSNQIGIELEKARRLESLKNQIVETEKSIARYRADRKVLLPKWSDKTSQRLQELLDASEKVRGYLRYFASQDSALQKLKHEVKSFGESGAPEMLRSLKERYQSIKFESDEWNRFLLQFCGDVDSTIDEKATATKRSASRWKGNNPSKSSEADTSFLTEGVELNKIPLATLEAEIARLERLVAADRETARKLDAISKKLTNETNTLVGLKERLEDYEGASTRAHGLVTERQEGYKRVFDAIVNEERVLVELYAPMGKRLEVESETLAKLTFTVKRIVDVERWARQGEKEFLDLRVGPFKGTGSLATEANEFLANAWENGNSDDVQCAMSAFLSKHQQGLLAQAPNQRTDYSKYRQWAIRFARWLFSTDHISIEYGIQYDGIDLHKLSPGTRGIVLLLLYLALDDADDRPLIIDQPEDNLDPRSIYDELVPLFRAATRKRQVILVTHNANLVVNTDADQIIIANVGELTGVGLPPISYKSGGLEDKHIRELICNTLEGGELAFRDRARRLRIGLAP